MIDFGTYYSHFGYTTDISSGQIRKENSDRKIEVTWDRDIQSKKCYLYDYYHDDEPTRFSNLNSVNSKTKIPIDAKFIVNRYNFEQHSQVPFSIQFKPSQRCNIPYYKEIFTDVCNAEFPLGLYIDIPDSEGVYRKWLICQNGNKYNQFVTWFVLPCDYKFQWIANGKKYEMCGTCRTTASYTDGKEIGTKISTLDRNKTILLPFNDISNTLETDKRLIISAVKTVLTTWIVTNIDSMDFPGVNRISVQSDKFDRNTDYIEKDDNGKVIGMWADYYKSNITPINVDYEQKTENIAMKILYKGVSPTIKTGGSSKTLFVKCYDSNGNETVLDDEVLWTFDIDNTKLSEDVLSVEHLENGVVKIKMGYNYEYVNSVINVSAIVKELTSTLQLEVKGF